MQRFKMNPALAMALTGTILAGTLTIGSAFGSTKRVHTAHRTHKITKVVVAEEPMFTPLTCGMRYYGGPKGGMWPAPCPGK